MSASLRFWLGICILLIHNFAHSVSMKSNKNKMSVFNLGVVFGPTLLRAVEETVAAILDIKFNNVVIEILIENYDLIFKNTPGASSKGMSTVPGQQHEYNMMSHSSSPPEPVPRTYGGGPAFRSARNSLTTGTQPVVRVVARSNYTDSLMSSSLQNIPNGMAIYQNSNSSKSPSKNHHPIYDTKPAMNQSTPQLNRDLRGMGVGGGGVGGIGAGGQTMIDMGGHRSLIEPPTFHSNNLHSPRDALLQSSGSSSSAKQLHHALTSSREKLHLHRPSDARSVDGGLYGQTQQRFNNSDINLSAAHSAIIDRINSTSSSNESVCSTSSLNHSPYSRHLHQQQPQSQLTEAMNKYHVDYATVGGGGGALLNSSGGGSTNKYGMSSTAEGNGGAGGIGGQNYLPKKTQRTKDIGRQQYNSPRDNV